MGNEIKFDWVYFIEWFVDLRKLSGALYATWSSGNSITQFAYLFHSLLETFLLFSFFFCRFILIFLPFVFKWIFLNLLMIFPSWYPAHCSMAHVSLTFPNVTICLHKSIDFYCLCTCLHLLVFLCIFQCLYFVHHDMYLNMYVSKILLIHAYVHIHA